MSFSRKLLSCLAVLTIILAINVLETDAQTKIQNCCTKVSTKIITVPILGYRIQRWNPPCVKAVIFETEDGPKCSHWKEGWVFQKVKELERARRMQATTVSSAMTNSTSI